MLQRDCLKSTLVSGIHSLLNSQYLSSHLRLGQVVVFPHIPQEAAVAVGSFVGFYGVSETKRIILDNLRTLLSAKKQSETNDDSRD